MVDIQWYPGHMEKARRQMSESLKVVDMILEVRDARIPYASQNPILAEMAGSKPRLVLLSKSDLADPVMTKAWIQALDSDHVKAMEADILKDSSLAKKIVAQAQVCCAPVLEKMIARGIKPRAMRALVAGIPNVGKSTLINAIAKKKKTITGDKPGVTKSLSWIHADAKLDLLDTPGVLWPKFEDQKVGTLLAITGAINAQVLSLNMVAMDAIHILQDLYPGVLEKEYQATGKVNPNQMLKAIAQTRHLLSDEGALDTRRAAELFLQEYRRGKLGRFTLEKPSE